MEFEFETSYSYTCPRCHKKTIFEIPEGKELRDFTEMECEHCGYIEKILEETFQKLEEKEAKQEMVEILTDLYLEKHFPPEFLKNSLITELFLAFAEDLLKILPERFKDNPNKIVGIKVEYIRDENGKWGWRIYGVE